MWVALSITVDLRSAGRADIPMFVRITALVLVSTLAFTVAAGLPLHSSEHRCAIQTEVQGCEHAEMQVTEVIVPSVSLCCLLDCQKPGPTASVFNLRIPSFTNAFNPQLSSPLSFPLAKPSRQLTWLQSSPFTPPEHYLKNLALLI